MRRVWIVVVVLASIGCSKKKTEGTESSGKRSAVDEAVAQVETEALASHPDCDAVMTREMRDKFGVPLGRMKAHDEFMVYKTSCASFRGPDRSVSVTFECWKLQVEKELGDTSSANWKESIAMPGVGRRAWVSPHIMTIVDDDTDCVISIQAFREKEHLSGQALIDGLGELPAALVKQLTPKSLLSPAEAKLRDEDKRNESTPREVDCEAVIDDAARAAYPGGLTWGQGKHGAPDWMWKCKPLRDSTGKELQVEFACTRSRHTAMRIIDMFNGKMEGPAVRYPMAAAEAFLTNSGFEVLDTDTNCVVDISFTLLDPMPTHDEFATRSAGFVKQVLANLTNARIR